MIVHIVKKIVIQFSQILSTPFFEIGYICVWSPDKKCLQYTNYKVIFLKKHERLHENLQMFVHCKKKVMHLS